MWQRIQTLYLFISTTLVAAMFFCDKAQGVSFTSYLPYTILLVIITLLDVLALTTWKWRIFQFRTAILSTLITLALQMWLAVDFFAQRDLLFKLAAVFPLTSAILNVLAARNIWADEMIVRSASHLRAAKRKQNSK